MQGDNIDDGNILNQSPQCTEEGTQELYLYSLRKMAEKNAEDNRVALTGLYNKQAFFYKTAEVKKDHPDKKYALIVLDIANFKTVNEFCGRSEGDRLLKYIGEAFGEYEDEYNIPGHFRADIFWLFTTYEEEIELVNITKDITRKIKGMKLACRVLPGFGICVDEDAIIPVGIMADYANMALNTIKGKFYSNYAFFDSTMRRQLLLEKQIENDIVEALEEKQLHLYIQPKVNMETKEIIGGEALVRWIHPVKGMIEPSDFLPVLEKNGLIINVDIYVWTEVFKLLAKRLSAGGKVVPISVNVSRMHAYDKNFRKCLCDLSEEYHVPPAYVPLELTESAFLEKEDIMYANMAYLKEQGFVLSMDDFGTGYSTMAMLKNQPIDEIKIDRGFIVDMDNDKSKVIVSQTIEMLKQLNMTIVAEGVEREEQQDFLKECGCNEAQGYFYYRPMPSEDFEKLL